MSNIEKLINLQRRFEKDARNFADKEDYASFEKAVENFIIEAGKINPDINTRDLLSRHLSKASKIKDQRGALQLMNSVISDITILSNSVNENENHLNEDKESLEKINQVFDTFKGEVNELLGDYEDDMKDNFEDEFKKLLEKLNNKFHDIMSSDDYVAFDKEEKVISSMFIDFCDELNVVVAGCLNAFKSNCINASNRFKAGMRGVRSITDREVAEQGIKRFIDSILTMVKNIERSKSFSKEYEKKYRRSFEEIINNHIWGGDVQFASGSKKLEEKLRNLLFKDDIFSMGVTSDILRNIALSVNGVDISKDKLLTSVKNIDLVRDSKQRLLGKIERYGESYKEVAEHSILPIFYNLKNDAKSVTDLNTLKKNLISYVEKAENGGTYSKFLESYKKDILSAVDSFCKDFTKITDIKVDSQQRNFESKVNDILKEYSDIFPYGTEYYFDQEIKDNLSDDTNDNVKVIDRFHETYGEELSDIFYDTIHEDIKKEIENLIDKLNNFINESKGISESRRDIFFEAEEDKKPKISKEEREKLKAQLDNFFIDKKEAKATELKKSIVDRDKAIEDVILKYSTEKEKIQREYSKSIQAAKSEAEANKLRAERDEELQRLSLEKATSIEDLKERQKKEEASIREKYQSILDKKLEEYKDSLGDAIHDFTKDIERGIENGVKSNPIFQ